MKKKIYLLSIIFIIFDQITKKLIIDNFSVGQSFNIIKNFFSLTLVHNDGGAFNIFSGNIFFLVLVAIGALYLLNGFVMEQQSYKKYELGIFGMLVGGIIGNLIDRIRFNVVIDFLDFKLFGYDFPVFNFADVFIVCSIILIIVKILFFEDKKVVEEI